MYIFFYYKRIFVLFFSARSYATDCYKEEYHLLDIRWLDDKLTENEGQPLRDTLTSLSTDFQKVSLVMLHALAMALGG